MSAAIETTCDLVRHNSERHATTPFLSFYDEIISYRALEQRTNTFANYLLGEGVGRGDVVSYMLGNSPAVFDVLLGAQRLGAIGGPVSCWWQAAEVEYLVNDSRAKVLVVDPEYVALAAEIADKLREGIHYRRHRKHQDSFHLFQVLIHHPPQGTLMLFKYTAQGCHQALDRI